MSAWMDRQVNTEMRFRWEKRYALSPVFATLHCDLGGPQFVLEEIYHVVVPEELHLLDFSNIEGHINVTCMAGLRFEGPSENRDIKCSISWRDEHLQCQQPTVSPNNGCWRGFSANTLNDFITSRDC